MRAADLNLSAQRVMRGRDIWWAADPLHRAEPVALPAPPNVPFRNPLSNEFAPEISDGDPTIILVIERTPDGGRGTAVEEQQGEEREKSLGKFHARDDGSRP